MMYLICMLIGSTITIATACMAQIGHAEKPPIPKTAVIVDAGSEYAWLIDISTGEVIKEYEFKSMTEWGESTFTEVKHKEKRYN